MKNTRKLQRKLYLTQRTLGDYDALKRGRLPRRLVRRSWHRGLIRALRKGGFW